MSFLRAAGLALTALSLTLLSACGGGGDSGSTASNSSNLTLHTATTATAAGAYQSSDVSKEVTQTDLGPADSITFNFGRFEAGVSYIQRDPSIYVVGFSDASGDYVCASTSAAATLGLATCPSSVQVDLPHKTAQFTNTQLSEINNSNLKVTVSGTLKWK